MKFIDMLNEGKEAYNKNFLKRFKEFVSVDKYDDFIKKNKKHIEKRVNEIKEKVGIISDKKLRDKKFKNEMRELKIDLTKVWDILKKGI